MYLRLHYVGKNVPAASALDAEDGNDRCTERVSIYWLGRAEHGAKCIDIRPWKWARQDYDRRTACENVSCAGRRASSLKEPDLVQQEVDSL